ncbi:MAG TPA: hypothetical protein PKY16_02970, partial [Gemmiger qucibialis]|nr:hypothetical protein [Gemmiger qucibialis]
LSGSLPAQSRRSLLSPIRFPVGHIMPKNSSLYYKYDKKPPNTCMKCKNFMGNSAFLPEMTAQHQKAA